MPRTLPNHLMHQVQQTDLRKATILVSHAVLVSRSFYSVSRKPKRRRPMRRVQSPKIGRRNSVNGQLVADTVIAVTALFTKATTK